MPDVQPTLDLIDGAIEDYLSPDAMRWTPDEDQRAEASPADVRTFDDWMAEQMRLYLREQEQPVVGSAFRRLELTDWQRDVIERPWLYGNFYFSRPHNPTPRGFISPLETARQESERICRVFGVPPWAINPGFEIVDEIHAAQSARRARMRYLHAAYRHRQLARRRRNR